jgi:hypothetical protein
VGLLLIYNLRNTPLRIEIAASERDAIMNL